ncbi:hypothetical protein F5B21DRAFT_240577 [Xylaria acuta]|nr:hypothetical protein F5B21DRAFT_240577 [Xylaria acuta]
MHIFDTKLKDAGRFKTHVSALISDNQTLREQMLGDIRDLVRRYGNLKPGDAGYA